MEKLSNEDNFHLNWEFSFVKTNIPPARIMDALPPLTMTNTMIKQIKRKLANSSIMPSRFNK